VHAQARRCHAPFASQVEQILADLLAAHLGRRSLVVLRELARTSQVRLDGAVGQPPQLEVLAHPVSQLSHGVSPEVSDARLSGTANL